MKRVQDVQTRNETLQSARLLAIAAEALRTGSGIQGSGIQADGPHVALWRLLREEGAHWPLARLVALRTILSFPPFRRQAQTLMASAAEADGEGIGIPGDVQLSLSRLWALEGLALQLEVIMQDLSGAWQTHPGCNVDYYPPEKPWKAEVLICYDHPPGRRGETLSILQASFEEGLTPHEADWCAKRMGEFAGLLPVPPSLPVSRQRIGYLNNSARTAASRGYFVRERLRALLPTTLRPWIARARRAYRTPKYELLSFVVPGGWKVRRASNGRIDQTQMYHPQAPGAFRPTPRAYQEKTKQELWLRYAIPPAVQQVLSAVIDLKDFWAAATGQVHPEDVDRLLKSERHARLLKRAGGSEKRSRPEQRALCERADRALRKDLRVLHEKGQPTLFMEPIDPR